MKNVLSNQYCALQKACEEKGFKLAYCRGDYWIIDGFNKYYTHGTFEQVAQWLEYVETPFDAEAFPIPFYDDVDESEKEVSPPMKTLVLFSLWAAIILFGTAMISNNLTLGFIGLPFLVISWYGFYKNLF